MLAASGHVHPCEQRFVPQPVLLHPVIASASYFIWWLYHNHFTISLLLVINLKIFFFFLYSDNIAKNIFVFIFFLQVYCEIIDWRHCLSLRCPARWFDFHVLCNDHDGFRGPLYSPTDTMKRSGFYQFWFFWIISFEWVSRIDLLAQRLHTGLRILSYIILLFSKRAKSKCSAVRKYQPNGASLHFYFLRLKMHLFLLWDCPRVFTRCCIGT